MLTTLRLVDVVGEALNYADEHVGLPAIDPTDDFAPYVQLDDEAPIPDLNAEPLNTEGSLVVVDSLEELDMAFRAMNLFMEEPVPSSDIQISIRHEGQHAEGTRAAGFRGQQYGLQIVSPRPDVYVSNAFHACYDPARPITKLELAAIYAMPDDPSTYDLTKIATLGYDSLRQLRSLIRAHNAHTGHTIPIPHSLAA